MRVLYLLIVSVELIYDGQVNLWEGCYSLVMVSAGGVLPLLLIRQGLKATLNICQICINRQLDGLNILLNVTFIVICVCRNYFLVVFIQCGNSSGEAAAIFTLG